MTQFAAALFANRCCWKLFSFNIISSTVFFLLSTPQALRRKNSLSPFNNLATCLPPPPAHPPLPSPDYFPCLPSGLGNPICPVRCVHRSTVWPFRRASCLPLLQPHGMLSPTCGELCPLSCKANKRQSGFFIVWGYSNTPSSSVCCQESLHAECRAAGVLRARRHEHV